MLKKKEKEKESKEKKKKEKSKKKKERKKERKKQNGMTTQKLKRKWEEKEWVEGEEEPKHTQNIKSKDDTSCITEYVHYYILVRIAYTLSLFQNFSRTGPFDLQ